MRHLAHRRVDVVEGLHGVVGNRVVVLEALLPLVEVLHVVEGGVPAAAGFGARKSQVNRPCSSFPEVNPKRRKGDADSSPDSFASGRIIIVEVLTDFTAPGCPMR